MVLRESDVQRGLLSLNGVQISSPVQSRRVCHLQLLFCAFNSARRNPLEPDVGHNGCPIVPMIQPPI